MINKLGILIFLLVTCSPSQADNTAVGKIVWVEGHVAADCRRIRHKENSTGTERFFRMEDMGSNNDSVMAVALTALAGNRDVTIFYDPAQTTGCGTEPRVHYIIVQ